MASTGSLEPVLQFITVQNGLNELLSGIWWLQKGLINQFLK
jgi:hypothetical protein